MIQRILTALLLLSGIGAAPAQAATEWGIYGEEKARMTVKVVDILCELTGDCPADCGGGKRQFGLLQEDGTLLLAIKNFDPFAGTAADLAPFCGKTIEADGLLIKNDRMPMFVLQFKREIGGKWARANWFTRDWAERTGMKPNGWFRKDPEVLAEIEKNGVLGLPGVEYVEE